LPAAEYGRAALGCDGLARPHGVNIMFRVQYFTPRAALGAALDAFDVDVLERHQDYRAARAAFLAERRPEQAEAGLVALDALHEAQRCRHWLLEQFGDLLAEEAAA
jgi:hypothetical protein